MPFQVSINKSPVQFMPRDMEFDWLRYLTQLGVSGANMVIEITEGLLLHASSQVKSKLLEYRDAGNQTFVRDIAGDHGNRTIAETIIVMAHKRGLKVIAEGIETREQMPVLAEVGCDDGQGFYFSRPLPADGMDRMLSQTELVAAVRPLIASRAANRLAASGSVRTRSDGYASPAG
jgi:EAL domain-containing protein (putative c-di-GMP-specific phosphodiesterase class I)